ncbi:MAG: hypothetical protein ACIALR_08635, partial [Blastopirellula sp. JB062]
MIGAGVSGRSLWKARAEAQRALQAANLPTSSDPPSDLLSNVGAPTGLLPGFDPTKGFASFNDFKKAFGAAGPGQAWHHVVEQTINSGKFAPELLHNPANLFRLPHGKGTIHAKISGYYSSKIPGLTGNKTVREW